MQKLFVSQGSSIKYLIGRLKQYTSNYFFLALKHDFQVLIYFNVSTFIYVHWEVIYVAYKCPSIKHCKCFSFSIYYLYLAELFNSTIVILTTQNLSG